MSYADVPAPWCIDENEWRRMTPTQREAAERRCRRMLVAWTCCGCCVIALLPLLICAITQSCGAPAPMPTPAPPIANMTTGMSGGVNSTTPAPSTPAPPAGPFCCVDDPYVGINSTYVSAEPTLCGDYDYNCDGINTTYACCYNVDSIVNGTRTLYDRDSCAVASGGEPLSTSADDLCGACSGTSVFPGWACNEPLARKRFVLPCPATCGELVAVTPETPPALGECALFTDHCVPPHGGDGEQCCLVTMQ